MARKADPDYRFSVLPLTAVTAFHQEYAGRLTEVYPKARTEVAYVSASCQPKTLKIRGTIKARKTSNFYLHAPQVTRQTRGQTWRGTTVRLLPGIACTSHPNIVTTPDFIAHSIGDREPDS
jgi:hypothetical protein